MVCCHICIDFLMFFTKQFNSFKDFFLVSLNQILVFCPLWHFLLSLDIILLLVPLFGFVFLPRKLCILLFTIQFLSFTFLLILLNQCFKLFYSQNFVYIFILLNCSLTRSPGILFNTSSKCVAPRKISSAYLSWWGVCNVNLITFKWSNTTFWRSCPLFSSVHKHISCKIVASFSSCFFV